MPPDRRLSRFLPRVPYVDVARRAAAPWLLSAGFAAAVVVAVVARSDGDAAVAVGAAVSGALALAVGLDVAVRDGGRQATARRAVRLFGSGMALWGVGQLLLFVACVRGTPSFPTAGDVVATCSAPLAAAGLLLALRVSTQRAHWLRMGLDATLLGTALGLLLWRVTFRSVLFAGGFSTGDAFAVLIVLAETTLAALVLLAWLRDLDPALLLMVVGFALYVVADQYTMHTLVQGRWYPWPAASVWCVAWPVMGIGLRRYRPAESAGQLRGAETRVTAFTTTATLLALGGALVSIAFAREVDLVSTGIGLAVVLTFGVREVYGGVQRARMLRRLTRHAFQDPLTGLANRRSMNARLRHLDDDPTGAVLTLDLDGFKEVNDQLGHARGDDLLVAVARQITGALPVGCEAYRVGGDEFVVVVPGPPARTGQVADALLVAARRAADTLALGSSVGVSASVGTARWSLPRRRPGRLGDAAAGRVEAVARAVLVESGVALHAAKESGRDRVEGYDGPVAARHRRSLDVERRLRAALANDALEVHYQPVIGLDTDRVVAFEALARWTDDELGRVGPEEFVAAAERTGLIHELGRQVMRTALRETAGLTRGADGLKIGLNVSPVQLRSPLLADDVLALVAEAGVDPRQVVVEVTESVLVNDDDLPLQHLYRLRENGMQVAIDDFGTGYSSLTYLSRLPATILKVDRSLTLGIVSDPRALAVMRAVLELGRALQMRVTVEGIEDQRTHDLLRSLGPCSGQGWLYAAAVPRAELPALVDRLNSGRAAFTA